MQIPKTKTLKAENIRVFIWLFLAAGGGTDSLNGFLSALMESPETLSSIATLLTAALNGVWWFFDRNIKDN